MNTYLDRPWRQGRKVPRHIYAQLGDDSSDLDVEIAVAIGPEGMAEVIAHTIVSEHNRLLEEFPP